MSSRRKPVLFLPCLRAKLVANLKFFNNHSLYESDFNNINNNNNNMRSLSRSTIYRKVRNFGSSNSYTKLRNRNRNRGDDDDDDDDDEEESKEQRFDGTKSSNIKKNGSTNIAPSSSSRMSNAIRRRVRKRRRFRGISYYAKLKWISPIWILQRLKSIYGSFFFVDGASSASTPMLMMGLHLSIPQHFPTSSLHAIL